MDSYSNIYKLAMQYMGYFHIMYFPFLKCSGVKSTIFVFELS